ncbi:hypothetical protein LCGC14_2549140, partial [marine sediment metagenome]
CSVDLGAAMDILKAIRWQARIAWHSMFGHPRPWRVLEQGMFCDRCGEEIRLSPMWDGICVQCAPGYAAEAQRRVEENNSGLQADHRPSRVKTSSDFNQSEYQRDYYLRTKYRITLDQYNEILLSQGGLCAICGGQEHARDRRGFIKPLSVDHNHEEKKGEVRGLLCSSCNTAIGQLDHDSDRLRAAAQYLEDPPARKILEGPG